MLEYLLAGFSHYFQIKFCTFNTLGYIFFQSLQAAHDFNNKFTGEMTEWLFKAKGKDFGLDIVALNVQRGRDHQIQGYVAYKSVGLFPYHKNTRARFYKNVIRLNLLF